MRAVIQRNGDFVEWFSSLSRGTMKVQGNGQAKVLTSGELALLFEKGFVSPRDRVLFGICLFTGCRISEALGLRREDVGMATITFRRGMTKGKLYLTRS